MLKSNKIGMYIFFFFLSLGKCEFLFLIFPFGRMGCLYRVGRTR